MRVVATLTTRPAYHINFLRCLDSLLCQFDAVYLGLPRFSSKGIKYKKFSYKNVKVVELDEDIGPATKLLAGFKHEQGRDTLIVSVDDDNEYAPFLRSSLEAQREKDIQSGQTRVIANAGHYIKYWNVGTLGFNGGGITHPDMFFDLRHIKYLTKISGFGGVAYPNILIPDIYNLENFIKQLCKTHPCLFSHDDISISAYLCHNNIKIILNPDRRKSVRSFLFKGAGAEEICEDFISILSNCHKIRQYFKKNPFKYCSLVLFDVAIITVIFVCFLIF